MFTQEDLMLLNRLQPIVHTLGWEVVKTLSVNGELVVTLMRIDKKVSVETPMPFEMPG